MANRTYNWNGLAESKMNGNVVGIIKSLFNDYLVHQEWATCIWPGSGWRTGSTEHQSGRAVDLMITSKVNKVPSPSDREAGSKLVALLLKHGKVLGIQWVLFSLDDKTTWSFNFDRGTWSKLGDRGSVSANHRDHVHVYFKRGAKLPSGFVWGNGGSVPTKPTDKWDGKTFPGEGAFTVGHTHPAVKVVQERLKVHGFDPGEVDSYWGPRTSAATKRFQQSKGWSGSGADGIPGPKTWAELKKAPSGPTRSRYKVITKGEPLNGRTGPGTSYRVKTTAASGYVLDIVETRGGWAKSTGGNWYSMEYLKKVG